MKFTPKQLDAINTISQNLQIIACAGSGKTQVVSQRIINILSNGVSPSKIIAFTYTEKAAGELQARILKLCREQLPEVKGLADMYVGTIHAWCLNVLQDYKYEYQKYSVLDEVKLKLFIDKNFNHIGMKPLNMERFKDTGHFIQLLSILREAEFIDRDSVEKTLFEALDQYEETLNRHCYFDFTMIMTRAINHLRHDEGFRNKVKRDIGYLVVDEYQDVNPIQEQIVRELYGLGANVCVVGDDDQTIFQWRGSNIDYIQNFKERYKNVKDVIMNENFRSSKAIVDVALKCIKNNTDRLPKQMEASGFQVYERGDILYNQLASVNEENEFIVRTINNLRGTSFTDKEGGESRGLDYSDFVILVRKWKKADAISDALQSAGIPFIVTGVTNLFQRPEASASQGIFSFLGEAIDAGVLFEQWESLSPRIKKDKLNKAIEWLEKQKPTPKTYYESFNLQSIFQDFLYLAGIREDVFCVDCANPVSGYNNEEVVFYNLGMFSQIIHDFETIYFKTMDCPRKLSYFLDFLRYTAEGYYPEGWLNNTYKTPNAVQIMTVYQAKGLEYPVVFIPGLNKNYLPTNMPTGKQVWHYLCEFSPVKENLPKKEKLTTVERVETISKYMIRNINRYLPYDEDERRLMYVAITRSKKYLIMSRSPDGRMQQNESKFAAEVRTSDYVFSSKDRDYSERKKLEPRASNELANISLNFSLLKSFFECPYSFKFWCFYGFIQPLGARIGFGSSIHNSLMELHREYLESNPIQRNELRDLVDRHINFPYATDAMKVDMTDRANRSVEMYYDKSFDTFDQIEFAEQEIQLDMGDGIIISGRMDLIKKKNLDGTIEKTIIDFKSTKDDSQYNATIDQLQLYALGYRELTGSDADFLEIYNVAPNDEKTTMSSHKFEITLKDLDAMRNKIISAANDIRNNNLEHACNKPECVCRFKETKE